MRKITILAAASLLGVAGASGVLGTATAGALINGTDIAAEDDNAAGVVQVASCTGTVVDSHWVLTAQHCVEVPDLQRSVYVGTTREQQHRKENKYLSDYAVWAPHGDVALVHVTDALPQHLIRKVRRAPVSFGDQGRVYGWGAGTAETLRYARAAVGKTTPGIRPQGTQHDAFVVQYLDEAQPGRGDSGGPLFINGEVAGVTSFKAPQGGGRYSLFASLHELVDWIAQTTASPAQPSTNETPAEAEAQHPDATAPDNQQGAAHQNAPAVNKPEQPHRPQAAPGRVDGGGAGGTNGGASGGGGSSLGLSSF